MAANVDPNEEHEVEKVERSGTIDGRLYFSVKWVNPLDPNMKSTLVWADEMPNAQEAIGDYCKKVGVANTQELTAQILSGEFRRLQEEKAAAIKKKKAAKRKLQEQSNGVENKSKKSNDPDQENDANMPSTSSSGAPSTLSIADPSSSSSGVPSTSHST